MIYGGVCMLCLIDISKYEKLYIMCYPLFNKQ